MPFDSRTTGTPGVKYGSPTISRPRRLTSTTSREESDCCVKGVSRAYVRLHAVAGDVDARRRQVPGDGQFQRGAGRQLHDLLDERLPVGRLADDRRATMVLPSS